ncbi:MAG TPA: hypothetical protein ENK28_12160 [Aliiroseovarius sp.]|nr:hypothetical protein [Aliiroseovarius sp.]
MQYTSKGPVQTASVGFTLAVAEPEQSVSREPGEVTRAIAQPVLHVPQMTPALPIMPRQENLVKTATNPAIVPDPDQEITPLTNNTSADCEAGFTAMAAPGAMVDLTLEAPCYAGQVVDIFHAGLRFTERLDQNGIMQLNVPAMEEDAFFNALFKDGRTESTDILMLTASDYQRVALAWQGLDGFELYALENGADYGEAGHVGSATPYSPERGTAGEGGFLNRFGQGENGYYAAIYSYPIRLTDTGRLPEISIEAEVLDSNCSREINATMIRKSATGTLETSPLVIAVPGCNAIGEYLVLKNLPQNQRIAGN